MKENHSNNPIYLIGYMDAMLEVSELATNLHSTQISRYEKTKANLFGGISNEHRVLQQGIDVAYGIASFAIKRISFRQKLLSEVSGQ